MVREDLSMFSFPTCNTGAELPMVEISLHGKGTNGLVGYRHCYQTPRFRPTANPGPLLAFVQEMLLDRAQQATTQHSGKAS